MGVGGWIGMIAFWAVVVALVIWGVCRLFPAHNATDARVALDQRLARGEIDPETYRLVREELDSLEAAGKGMR
jgi:putative membrane protein